MPDIEDARLGVYDHESDPSLPRLRRAPDWGGDDLFTTMPVRRRRFAHGTPSRARREDIGHAEARAQRPAPALEIAPPAVAIAPEPVEAPPASEPQAARPTIQVTGRPGEAPAFAPARRRSPRTARTAIHDRVGARPDRVAGWACGLGALLILVAVTTADAAPL